jgi:hypothetical protein
LHVTTNSRQINSVMFSKKGGRRPLFYCVAG